MRCRNAGAALRTLAMPTVVIITSVHARPTSSNPNFLYLRALRKATQGVAVGSGVSPEFVGVVERA